MSINFLIILVMFLLWRAIKHNSYDRKAEKNTQKFWERESHANTTRKRSLDSLSFVTIPLERLPILENPSGDIEKYQQKVQLLATKKLVNLSGQTNTDLKLAYGAANLELLSEYDQNFQDLLFALYRWGKALHEASMEQEAITVLEYGIGCRTDISKHYTLLAEIYKQKNTPEKISRLVTMAEQLDCLMKPSILKSLNEIEQSCHAPE